MELWQTILALFGGNAILLMMLAYFGRSLVDTLLTKNVAQFKAELEAASETAIERLRADLHIAAVEHEVRFSRLHEKRAEVLAELYRLLVAALTETQRYSSQADGGELAEKREKYVRAINAIGEYFRYFDHNRIYLPESLCILLEAFDYQLRAPANKFWVYGRIEHPTPATFEKMNDAWDKAWEALNHDAPKLRAAIENEFRQLLGALPNSSVPST